MVGDRLFIPSLCDFCFQFIWQWQFIQPMMEHPGLERGKVLLYRQWRNPTCHPLGSSLCSLSLELRSQPEPHLPVLALSLDGDKGHPHTHSPSFGVSIPNEFNGQRPIDAQIFDILLAELNQVNAAPRNPRRRSMGNDTGPCKHLGGDDCIPMHWRKSGWMVRVSQRFMRNLEG